MLSVCICVSFVYALLQLYVCLVYENVYVFPSVSLSFLLSLLMCTYESAFLYGCKYVWVCSNVFHCVYCVVCVARACHHSKPVSCTSYLVFEHLYSRIRCMYALVRRIFLPTKVLKWCVNLTSVLRVRNLTSFCPICPWNFGYVCL